MMMIIGMLFLLAAARITGVSGLLPHVPSCCPIYCAAVCGFSKVEEKEGVDPVNDGKKERVVPRAHSGRPPT